MDDFVPDVRLARREDAQVEDAGVDGSDLTCEESYKILKRMSDDDDEMSVEKLYEIEQKLMEIGSMLEVREDHPRRDLCSMLACCLRSQTQDKQEEKQENEVAKMAKESIFSLY